MNDKNEMNMGEIAGINGPVVDVLFNGGELPKIKEELFVSIGKEKRVMEVASHIGGNLVRCIMLGASEGLHRGMPVTATNNTICVPVGDAVLGRLFNVLGETLDNGQPLSTDTPKRSIYKAPPEYSERKNSEEILETGIKVIDLLAPYLKGGKIGLFGGAGAYP